MQLPTNRRDRIVMGLSICALILFMANIATFIKQRFFENHDKVHHAYVVSGVGESGHVHFHASGDDHRWEVRHRADGNEVWSVTSDDLDCELKRVRERIARMEERRQGQYAWRLEGNEVRRVEREVRRDVQRDLERVLEDARRARRAIERELGQAPRLEVESLLDTNVEVHQSQDETGRHRYRVVVRPESDSR